MINPVIILLREDLPRPLRGTPIEEVGVPMFPFLDLSTMPSYQAKIRTSELVIFVDRLDGNGRVKVLKSRCLGGLHQGDRVAVPKGTILPSDLLDDLLYERLDLSSPRVVLPPTTRLCVNPEGAGYHT